jgi:hypothetical protein
LPLTTGTTSQINAVAYTGLENIWAVGDNGLVLHSENADNTWEIVNILIDDVRLTDVEFCNNLGYIIGDCAVVYKTENYGESWVNQTIIEHPDPWDPWENRYYGFHSLNIMENKTYMQLFDYELFSTENNFEWKRYPLIIFSGGLYFVNDNTGYMFYYNSLLGSPWWGFDIYKTTDGGETWEPDQMDDASRKYMGSIRKSEDVFCNIVLVNDTLGYALFEQTLVKMPSPTVEIDTVGIRENKLSENAVVWQNRDNYLSIKSMSKPLSSIEIIDLSGKTVTKEQWNDSFLEKRINVNIIPNGMYLLKTTFSDKSVYVTKLIKN